MTPAVSWTETPPRLPPHTIFEIPSSRRMLVTQAEYEIDVLRGLKPILVGEIKERLPHAELVEIDDPKAVRLRWNGPPADLNPLRTAGSLNLLIGFPGPRPRPPPET